MSSELFHKSKYSPATPYGTHSWILYLVWITIFLGTFIPSAPWTHQHAVLFGLMGGAMLIAPSPVQLPRLWLILSLTFLLFSALSYLPNHWFPIPEWRTKLESLGVDTGSHVAIQWKHSLEFYGYYAALVFSSLWMMGHRPSSNQLRNLALLFSAGVAIYCLISLTLKGELTVNQTSAGHFGFFPNRNHTGTYLAMGCICGLGVILQALRDGTYIRLGLGILSSSISSLSILAWSISRGGIILLGSGFILWLLILGRHYLGKHESKALCLISLLAIGCFLLSETQVKTRLVETSEKISKTSDTSFQPGSEAFSPLENGSEWENVDFRVPTMLDTLEMIKDTPLTGVGAGQFYYTYPQYRERTSTLNYLEQEHPESDWLWAASEFGLPATITLLLLVGVATCYSIKHIRSGRDRAIKAACLVSGLLLAIHGIFDVPGHRLPLAWASFLMFTLSLPTTRLELKKKIGKAGGILSATAVLSLTFHLAWTSWYRPEDSLTSLGNRTYRAVMDFYKKNSNPQPEDTFITILGRVEKGEQLVTEALKILPLDQRLHRAKGCILLPSSQQTSEAYREFEIERALNPNKRNIFIEQGLIVSFYHPEQTVKLWRMALQQAETLKINHSSLALDRKKTEQRLKYICRQSSALQKIAKEAINSAK